MTDEQRLIVMHYLDLIRQLIRDGVEGYALTLLDACVRLARVKGFSVHKIAEYIAPDPDEKDLKERLKRALAVVDNSTEQMKQQYQKISELSKENSGLKCDLFDMRQVRDSLSSKCNLLDSDRTKLSADVNDLKKQLNSSHRLNENLTRALEQAKEGTPAAAASTSYEKEACNLPPTAKQFAEAYRLPLAEARWIQIEEGQLSAVEEKAPQRFEKGEGIQTHLPVIINIPPPFTVRPLPDPSSMKGYTDQFPGEDFPSAHEVSPRQSTLMGYAAQPVEAGQVVKVLPAKDIEEEPDEALIPEHPLSKEQCARWLAAFIYQQGGVVKLTRAEVDAVKNSYTEQEVKRHGEGCTLQALKLMLKIACEVRANNNPRLIPTGESFAAVGKDFFVAYGSGFIDPDKAEVYTLSVMDHLRATPPQK